MVFLNNDTVVHQGWLPPMVEALQRPDVAAVQPRLFYPEDGGIQCIGIVFSAKSPLGYPIYAGMQPDFPAAQRSRSFQAITGACLALRARDFVALQGFDPVYVNGQEDVDLCLRLNQRYGGKPSCWVVGESCVRHHESKTPNRLAHVACNRRIFVTRWGRQIQPDDQAYYGENGFVVGEYRPDSPGKFPANLQIYRPKVALGQEYRRAANAHG